MNKIFFFLVGLTMMISCGKKAPEQETPVTEEGPATEVTTTGGNTTEYDPERGEGKFSNVQLSDKLDLAMATEGEKISTVKCLSCHKLTDEKLVGPGWKGVTGRNKPEWIMNFITNPDPMIDKDPKVQAMMEICLVRMPNQSIAEGDARNILEYMRQNDGVK